MLNVARMTTLRIMDSINLMIPIMNLSPTVISTMKETMPTSMMITMIKETSMISIMKTTSMNSTMEETLKTTIMMEESMIMISKMITCPSSMGDTISNELIQTLEVFHSVEDLIEI